MDRSRIGLKFKIASAPTPTPGTPPDDNTVNPASVQASVNPTGPPPALPIRNQTAGIVSRVEQDITADVIRAHQYVMKILHEEGPKIISGLRVADGTFQKYIFTVLTKAQKDRHKITTELGEFATKTMASMIRITEAELHQALMALKEGIRDIERDLAAETVSSDAAFAKALE
jgi:hypothetical protein